MKAMLLTQLGSLANNRRPLQLADLPQPEPGAADLLVRVSACAICHTELDEIEGRTPPPDLPIVLGHQVMGRVEGIGDEVSGFEMGDRVGVACCAQGPSANGR